MVDLLSICDYIRDIQCQKINKEEKKRIESFNLKSG